MAVTLQSFRAFFPEFSDAGDTLIELHIADAVARTPTSIFVGSSADRVVKYRAADSLAQSPWGRFARIVADGQRSIYAVFLDTLLAEAPAAGPWVPGVCTTGYDEEALGLGLEEGDQ